MKKITTILNTLIITVGLTVSLEAQQPAYSWGKLTEIDGNDFTLLPYPLLEREDGFIFLHERRGPGEVDHWYQFDEELNKVKSERMAFNRGSEGNSRSIVDVVEIDGTLYMLYKSFKKNNFEHSLHRVELKSNMELTIRKSTLDQIYAVKEKNIGKFRTALSPDKKKILVFNEKPYDKKLKEKSSVRVYNTDNWKLDWKGDIQHEHMTPKNIYHKVAISNEGNVCIFKIHKTKKEKAVTFTLINNNGRQSQNLEFNDKKITDVKVMFDEQGAPMAVGVYETSKTPKFKNYGIFYIKLNKRGQAIVVQEYLDLEEKEEGDFTIDGKIDENSDALKGLNLCDVLMTSTGNLIILTELYEYQYELINTRDRLIPNNTFYHGNIFIRCINPDGKLVWSDDLKKLQKETGSASAAKFSSALPHLHQDELYIFWNNIELLLPYSSWEEKGQEEMTFKGDLFGKQTYYPSFLEVYSKEGTKRYGHYKYGLPLSEMHKDGREMMSMRTDIKKSTDKGLIIVSQASVNPKTFRVGYMNLQTLVKP